MKVGIVTPYFFPVYGGVQEHVFYLHQYLKNNFGVEAKIITSNFAFSQKLDKDEIWLKKTEEDTIRIGYSLPIPSNGSIGQIALPFKLKEKIEKILKKERFDILHIHEPLVPTLPLFTLTLGAKLGIPIVGTFHAYAPKNIFYSIFKKLLYPKFTLISAKIVVSKAVAQLLSSYFSPSEFYIIPNGIEVSRFSVADKNAKREDKVILFVSRLEPRKGLQYLIDALVTVKREIPEVILWVVGDGPLRNKYHIWKEVKENIKFFGFQHKELPSFYQKATVFCAPAINNESFGIILLESQAAGLPIVASNIPGYNEVIKDGYNGLFVPPKNSDILAKSLITLIKSKDLQDKLRENGLKEVTKYSWSNISQRIYEIYLKLKK